MVLFFHLCIYAFFKSFMLMQGSFIWANENTVKTAIVWIIIIIKRSLFFLNIFENIYSCDGKAEFSAAKK